MFFSVQANDQTRLWLKMAENALQLYIRSAQLPCPRVTLSGFMIKQRNAGRCYIQQTNNNDKNLIIQTKRRQISPE